MTTKANATDDSFHVFDTTLRDGAQREGINLTVADKLTIARHLDTFGVGYIEGGWPGANPRDTEFFARAQQEITFESTDPRLVLPNREYLAVHAACCRVAHLSGAFGLLGRLGEVEIGVFY